MQKQKDKGSRKHKVSKIQKTKIKNMIACMLIQMINRWKTYQVHKSRMPLMKSQAWNIKQDSKI